MNKEYNGILYNSAKRGKDNLIGSTFNFTK